MFSKYQRRMFSLNILVAIILLCLPVFAMAQTNDVVEPSVSGQNLHATIYLKDGGILEGQIVASDETTITIHPSSGGKFTISRKYIKEIKIVSGKQERQEFPDADNSKTKEDKKPTNKKPLLDTEAQKEGRVRVVINAVGYGLWLYGPCTIRLLEMESVRAAGLELLIAGGSFMAALKATKDYRLGYGRSKLMRWGSYAGTSYGLGIPVFFESENDKAYWGSAMLCTPLGGLIAYKLSSHRWFEKGETDLIASGGLVGGLYGVAIPYLINIEDLEEWNQAKIYIASAMAGVPIGVFGTTRLIRNKPISQGRANLITLGGIVGSYYGAGIVKLAGVDVDEHPRAYVLSMALS